MKDTWHASVVKMDEGKYCVYTNDGKKELFVCDLSKVRIPTPNRRIRVRIAGREDGAKPCLWLGVEKNTPGQRECWQHIGYYKGQRAVEIGIAYFRMIP